MLSLEMVLCNRAEQDVPMLPDSFSQIGASGSGARDYQNVRLCGCAHAILLMQTFGVRFAMAGNRLSVRALVSLTLVRPSHTLSPTTLW